MVSRPGGSSVFDVFHPVGNVAASATVFRLDPQEMLDLERAADAEERELAAIMHSHVDSSPYPSPTDVADSRSYDPSGHFVHLIVSLRHAEPIVRGYRIADGVIAEERVEIAEPKPTVHDQAGAVAAVARLPKPPPSD